MKKKIDKIDIGDVAPIVLFAMLAVCVLIVLLTGADVYRSFTDEDASVNMQRTAAQYISTRVRQSNVCDGFFVGDFYSDSPLESGDTYFIREEYSGVEYYTRIYCHDGYLYEMFSEADYDALPESGERIVELDGIFFSMTGNRLKIDVSYTDGTTGVLYFNMSEGIRDEK